MDWYLVKFKKDWADEFEVEGFFIVTKDEYDMAVSIINEIGDEHMFNFNFGSNEGWEDEETIKEVWDNNYSVMDISASIHVAAIIYETLLMDKLFCSFGIVPKFSDIFESIDHPLVDEYWNRYEFNVERVLEKTHFRGQYLFKNDRNVH